MSVPTAKEMADSLRKAGRALYQRNVIEAVYVFEELARNTVSHRVNDFLWSYEIPKSNPIAFKRKHDPHLNKTIQPQIYASISVQQSPTGGVCFNRLDLALEVLDDEANVLIKHHIDFANSTIGQFQEGPLFHLQFGGHTPAHTRSFEVPIKEPRWLCFPLDVVLLCEVVVANFYPEDWAALKALPGWNDPIVCSQRFCIIPFLNALQARASLTSRSLLDQVWAKSLGTTYSVDGFL